MTDDVSFDELLDEALPERDLSTEDELVEADPDETTEAAEAAVQYELKLKLLAEHGIQESTYNLWKERFGVIGLFAPREEDIYIWRQLRRPEWEKIQARAQQNEQSDPDVIKRLVLRGTILYPRLTPEIFNTSPAGLIDSLFEVVMHGSYFFSVQEALSYVIEL